MKQQQLWGIDLGGTKIEGVVLSGDDDRKILFRDRLPTEAGKGYGHVLGQIDQLVQNMEAQLGLKPASIGIGTPGSTDPETRLLKNSNSTVLNQQNLHDDLEKKLKMKVYMANDANCFAVAETKMGVVKEQYPDAKVVFGVIMGTGVGGGLVINGKVWNGKHGIAGEWGHNFLDESGGECYCGKMGCVERVISGPALERFYQEKSGEFKTLKEILSRINSDEIAKETLERLLIFFGKGLSSVVNMLDPDVIVLGGGVGNIQQLYSDGVESVKNFTFNPTFSTPIVAPKLGDSAGVFGAAFLNE